MTSSELVALISRITSIENDIKFYERKKSKRDTALVRDKLRRLNEQLRLEKFEYNKLKQS